MDKCSCHRKWPIENKKLGKCRACVFEYRNGGEETYEESQLAKSKATQERMMHKQIEKQKSKQETTQKRFDSKEKAVSSFGAGVDMDLDPDYARHLDRKAKEKKAPKPISKVSKRGLEQVSKDNETYEQVWSNRRDDSCENCGAYIGSELFDDKGKIMDRFRFSHVLTKGAHPEHRNDPLNFNLLCLTCHEIWETGDNVTRKGMAVWTKNQAIILELNRKYIDEQARRANRFED